MSLIVSGVAIGLFATLCINIWAFLLFKTIGMPMPNRAMMGRWAANFSRGKLFHESIATTPPEPQETAIGWMFHVCVGSAFGVMLAILVGEEWFTAPTPVPAVIFGIVTVGFGWFLMQPGMGLGPAGSKTPNPTKGRLNSLAGHVVFGMALWVGALLLAQSS